MYVSLSSPSPINTQRLPQRFLISLEMDGETTAETQPAETEVWVVEGKQPTDSM
jgi:hypothetical protein